VRAVKHLGYSIVVPDHVADWLPPDHEETRIRDIIEHGDSRKLLIDVGAEHGWQSALYAKHGGWLMGLVEPTSPFWPNILRCWQENDLQYPAFCSQWGLGKRDMAGPGVTFRGWPLHACGPEVDAGPYWNPDVTTTLDRLALVSGVQAISIDVEGAELDVLLGGGLTLGKRRPIVWVSVHPKMLKARGQSREQVLAYMRQYDYSPTHLHTDHEEHWRFDPR